MIYGDNELKEWWTKKSGFEKSELFDLILEKLEAGSRFHKTVAEWKRLSDRYEAMSPSVLQQLRKWES